MGSGKRAYRVLAVATAVMVGASVLTQLPATAAEGPAGSQQSVEETDGDALLAEHERAAQRAAITGKPVPVASLTTEREQVLALPRGGFERVASVEPVRVKKSGEWRDIDTTLVTRSDGAVAPKVAMVDLQLSGGGGGQPLAKMGHDDVTVSLGWDKKFWGRDLPEPQLHGDIARYRDVLDGVDLEIQVTATSFRQVLIVEDAEAARNPKLRKVRFDQHVDGGRAAKKQPPGQARAQAGRPAPSRLEVTDQQGEVVFEGNASQMWDSSGEIADQDREATVAEDDDRAAVMDVQVDTDSVEITPDQEFLADPATEYPVFIDPNYICTTCGARDDYLVVYEKNGEPGDTSWNNDDDNLLKVGHVHDIKARSYFDFDISDVPSSATINSARLDLTVNNSYLTDCSGTTTVYFTSYINSSMRWGNEPTRGWGVSGGGYVGTINNAYEGNKPSNESECTGNWNRTSSVTPGVQELRAAGRGQATFGLYASTYASSDDWRRFKTNPGLTIKYSLPPKTPTSRALLVDQKNLGCASRKNVDWVSKAITVEVAAKVSNPSKPAGGSYDGSSGSARAKFAVKRNGESGWTYHDTSYKPSGGAHTWTLSTSFIEEGYFEWRVRSEDRNGNVSAFVGSGVNESCFVMVDRTSPDTPRVASVDELYPYSDEVDGAAHGGVGKTGWFTFSPGTPTGSQGSMDVDHYRWSLGPDEFDRKAPARSDGTAMIAVTPTKKGPHQIYVKAVDKAGNFSLRVTPEQDKSNDHEVYSFNVAAGGSPDGSWELDGEGTDSASEADMTLRGSAAFGEGFDDQGLHLPGAVGSDAHTSSPVVNASTSFSVAAWTRLDSKTHHSTAVAQEGSMVSRFKLIYMSSLDRWTFTLYHADTSSPSVSRATAQAAPVAGRWTHVAGVFDAATGKARLYVDGKLQDEVVVAGSAWQGGDGLTIGSGKWNGSPGGLFEGDLDNVRAYDRALTPAELTDLANDSVERSRYELDEDSGTVATDSVGSNNGMVAGLADAGTANLVANADVEAWAGADPDCFEVTGWGDNTYELGPVAGRSGQAAGLTVSSYTDGLYTVGMAQASCAAAVEPGQSYSTSLWYRSDSDELSVNAFIQRADGTWTWWMTFDEMYAADDWTKSDAITPPVPDGVQRLAFGLTVVGEGTVAVDDFRTVLINEGTSNGGRPGAVAWDPYGPGAVFAGWGDEDMGQIDADLSGTVSSSGSFSMATFARHDGFDPYARQAVSLSGSKYMPVGLGYRPENDGRWVLTLITGSQDSPVSEFIVSDRPAAEYVDADGWVHLALTYDAARSEVRFFVNGIAQATTWELEPTLPQKLELTRPLAPDSRKLVIGRGTWPWPSGGYKADPWKGAVRDARLASGVVAPGCVSAWAEGGDNCNGGGW